jgi:hypothetical protein
MSIFYNLSSAETQERRKQNQFVFDQVISKFSCRRRYLVQNEYLDRPTGKPDQTEAVFNSDEDLKKAINIYNFYSYIKQESVAPMVWKGEIAQRIISSVKEQNMIEFFIPWGVRPNWDNDDSQVEPEMKALEKIREFQELCSENYAINTSFLFMFADTYATQVNSYDAEFTKSYFDYMTKRMKNCGLQNTNFVSYSGIVNNNQELYQELAARITPEWVYDKYANKTDKYVWNSALGAAGRRSGFSTLVEQRAAAIRYLREREIEGPMICKVYPYAIKYSMVTPSKDIPDTVLPRIYLLDEKLRLPWIPSQKGER